ncbi:hypothetical protein BGW42_008128 [Actinomortierella wolfii]|nr:hypothetical protein BGW42_008128 [Actinomortierella wolfii]
MTTTIERQHWLLTDLHFFLYHTICTFHVIVPVLYWGYNSISGEAKMMAVDLNKQSLWRNYSFHGLDLVLVLIEVAINSMPFVPSHLIPVILVALLYLAEAHIVHAVDGFWIYPFLDTSNKLWALLYLGVGFVIVAAFFAMYYLHRFKDWYIHRHDQQQQEQQQQQQQPIQGDTRLRKHSIDESEGHQCCCSDITLNDSRKQHQEEVEEEKQQQQQQLDTLVHEYYAKALSEEIILMDNHTFTAATTYQDGNNNSNNNDENEHIATPNRKRSCSNCSVASSVDTLVGGDSNEVNGGGKDGGGPGLPLSHRNSISCFHRHCSSNGSGSNGSSGGNIETTAADGSPALLLRPSPVRRPRRLSDPRDYRRHLSEMVAIDIGVISNITEASSSSSSSAAIATDDNTTTNNNNDRSNNSPHVCSPSVVSPPDTSRSLRQTSSASRYTAEFKVLRIRVERLNDSVAKASYTDGPKPDTNTLVLDNHSIVDASVDEVVALAEQTDSVPSHSRSTRFAPYHSKRQTHFSRPTPDVDPMAMELDSIRVQPRSGSHSRY